MTTASGGQLIALYKEKQRTPSMAYKNQDQNMLYHYTAQLTPLGRRVSLLPIGLLLVAMLFQMLTYTPAIGSSHIIYVDTDATDPTPDGTNWTKAYTNVQDALTVASSGDEIWVAQGVYNPDEGGGNIDNDRSATFQLVNGVALYGGYAGDGEVDPDARDVTTFVTVLSGDIDKDDSVDSNGVVTTSTNISGNNAYHVVTGSGTDATTVIDGFTVTAGLANGSSTDLTGGGMFNASGSPTIRYMIFSGNATSDGSNGYGGGMYNNDSSPSISYSTFTGNSARGGGGIYNQGGSPTISHSLFSGNRGRIRGGGGIFNGGSNVSISYSTFSGNSAKSGGAMYSIGYLGNTIISHSLFSGNTATGGSGGAIHNSQTTYVNISYVTIISNTASSNGGGIHNFIAQPTISYSTISGNSAAGTGGGMNNKRGNSSLNQVTISGNSAIAGGGVYNDETLAILTISNTVIANSISGGDCVNNSGTVTDDGYNLIEDGTCISAPTSISGDPALEPLADNGGPTLTHKPGSGSLLIDKGSCVVGTDQRGATRPYDDTGIVDADNGCDIGAVEVGQTLLSAPCGVGDLPIGDYGFHFTNSDPMTITVNSVISGLTCIAVEEMGENHLAATTGIQTGNWWHISGTVDTGLDVDITLPHASAGVDTRVCKWPGGLGGAGWDCDDGSNTTFSVGFVTRSNLTGFSDWAVGQGVNPTAVTLKVSEEQSAHSNQAVLWVAFALLLGSSGIVLARRSR